MTILVVALTVRLVVAVVIHVVFDGGVFGDDITYARMARDMAAGTTGHWDQFTRFLYWQTATFLLPLTLLYRLVGPAPLAGQLLVACFGTAAAVVTGRLGMEAAGRAWGLAAGLVVALLPSQVLWSTLTLKDAAVWAVTSAMALTIAIAARVEGWRWVAATVATAVLLFLLGHLRWHTMVVASAALAVAGWAGRPAGRLRNGLVAVAVAVLLPWYVGLGPLGFDLVTNAGSLAARRALNAQDAQTAFVAPPRAAPTTTTAPLRPQSPSPEAPQEAEPTGSADLAHLPRGLSVMVLEPYPWQYSGNLRVRLALAENLLWWPLLGLAAIGAPVLLRSARVLLFPVLYAGGVITMYALVEGNFGTAYRHRGEVVWVVAVLAALGGRSLMERRAARRAVPQPWPGGSESGPPPAAA